MENSLNEIIKEEIEALKTYADMFNKNQSKMTGQMGIMLERQAKGWEKILPLIFSFENQIQELKKELAEVKSKIILSTDNAHRSGRPETDGAIIALVNHLGYEGKPQEKIAEMTGISQSTVSRILAGKIPKSIQNNKLNKSNTPETPISSGKTPSLEFDSQQEFEKRQKK